MYYCADTWYLLKVFEHDKKALELLENAKYGKDRILIPLVVFAETTKKLLQRGIPQEKVDAFFDPVEVSEHIQFSFPDRRIATEAAHIALSFSLSLMDAFVAATARLSKCNILLSEDSDYGLLEKRNMIKTKSW